MEEHSEKQMYSGVVYPWSRGVELGRGQRNQKMACKGSSPALQSSVHMRGRVKANHHEKKAKHMGSPRETAVGCTHICVKDDRDAGGVQRCSPDIRKQRTVDGSTQGGKSSGDHGGRKQETPARSGTSETTFSGHRKFDQATIAHQSLQ